MIDLETIPVDIEVRGVRADAPLKEISIREQKLPQISLHRRVEDEPLLVDDSARVRLILDPQVGRHDRQVRINLEGISDTESLVDRTLPVPALPDYSEDDDILLLVDMFRQLQLAPELMIRAGRVSLRPAAAADQQYDDGCPEQPGQIYHLRYLHFHPCAARLTIRQLAAAEATCRGQSSGPGAISPEMTPVRKRWSILEVGRGKAPAYSL
jgi:hypothetical protein